MGYPLDRCWSHVFGAVVTASVDGWPSFLPAARMSSTPTCDDQSRTGLSTGDCFGVAPASDGSFRLVWAEMRDGVKHPVTTIVRVDR
jgi:hypothetical protein